MSTRSSLLEVLAVVIIEFGVLCILCVLPRACDPTYFLGMFIPKYGKTCENCYICLYCRLPEGTIKH